MKGEFYAKSLIFCEKSPTSTGARNDAQVTPNIYMHMCVYIYICM